jgi:hypothetical protein
MKRGTKALRLSEARFLVQHQPQLSFGSTAQHSRAQPFTAPQRHSMQLLHLFSTFTNNWGVRSANCNMRKVCCSVVGSALPPLSQSPANQHPAPSSSLALASPGTVEMNKRNLKRNMPSRLLHSATVTGPSPSLAAMCKPK